MTPQPVARALVARPVGAARETYPDVTGRNLTRVQQVRFTDATARHTVAGARGRGRSMDTREARTMTAATAVMCRMPACPATHGQLV
ncbi:hypothetical protein GXP71_10310 [Cellulomonas sp. H30R-01]|uniref:hypothetical protein n=1 Tax=Cellulomonas sp. H30R-01 TaxID=2704467 RepID=UPI00138C97F5|nr:hypothetical protein [Cellulomonas sp. H30R-01]QHT56426.1 hypothetical protein GXP71_10310 [Cellulomonas sp. H30R-01]